MKLVLWPFGVAAFWTVASGRAYSSRAQKLSSKVEAMFELLLADFLDLQELGVDRAMMRDPVRRSRRPLCRRPVDFLLPEQERWWQPFVVGGRTPWRTISMSAGEGAAGTPPDQD